MILAFALPVPPASADAGRPSARDAESPAKSFVRWFGPKVRAVLDETPGAVADRLPVKLVMAQAALESGWGKSKAAVMRKNFFGLMGSDGKPMRFQSPEESIRFYVKTLSEHRAYAGFRRRLATSGDPERLAHSLDAYSESPRYAHMLKAIIRSETLAFADLTDPDATPESPHQETVRHRAVDPDWTCSFASAYPCEASESRPGRLMPS